ncbi:hypothetical protein N2152v2_001175 [Parachlorella kessleri]
MSVTPGHLKAVGARQEEPQRPLRKEACRSSQQSRPRLPKQPQELPPHSTRGAESIPCRVTPSKGEPQPRRPPSPSHLLAQASAAGGTAGAPIGLTLANLGDVMPRPRPGHRQSPGCPHQLANLSEPPGSLLGTFLGEGPGHGDARGAEPGLAVEELEYYSDDSHQGWVPLRLVKQAGLPSSPPSRHPVAILLHATGGSKDEVATQQALFAGRGYLVAAIDCRYHGARHDPAYANPRDGYEAALVRAWRQGPERPFLLDNVWDLLRLLDLLETRPDADMARVGMTGISLGGMHTWLCAAADTRVAVAAPMIGVQYFMWAIENTSWHGRVASIPLVFEAARHDLGQPDVGEEVVEAVWHKLLPGLLDSYDAPKSLPLIAPRPLLIIKGETDPRCPLQGVEVALVPTRATYAALGAADKVQLFVEAGVGHECTATMWAHASSWLDTHLLGQAGGEGT